MEPFRHLVPSEVHHRHEGRFHEKRHDALDSQRCSEDITHEPRVITPVRTELKLKDDTRGDTHGKVDAEQFLPELRRILPKAFLCTVVACLHDAHDHSQSQCEWNEKPVVDGSQRELCSRPVYRPSTDFQ